MGLLHQLWDDTVAGPPPLGKLRKYNSFSPSTTSAAATSGAPWVTRSITIIRTPSSSPSSSVASSPRSPSSPASAPDSPLAPPGPWGDWRRLRNKPAQVAEGTETAAPRAPTVYDWFVPQTPNLDAGNPNSHVLPHIK
ncbi:dormancy-associated protein [Canna indica]|uniref:Dormancy-associated protein n=1 Tax=Canna indica TaxID=4628 RepID=A0AAQ3L325_9LILI|nr:dormancy-associated protein [Canna indica]